MFIGLTEFSLKRQVESNHWSGTKEDNQRIQEHLERIQNLCLADPTLQDEVLQYALEIQGEIPEIKIPETEPDLSDVPLDKRSQQLLKTSKYYSKKCKPLKSDHPSLSLYTSVLTNLKGSCSYNEALCLKLKCIVYCIMQKDEL